MNFHTRYFGIVMDGDLGLITVWPLLYGGHGFFQQRYF